MTPTEVRALAQLPESEQLEFKEELRPRPHSRIARLLAGFANADGGTLLVGVRDNGSFAGVRDVRQTQEILQAANSSIAPPVDLEVELIDIDGKNIIAVRINKDNHSHTVDNVTVRRIGDRILVTPVPPLQLEVAIVGQDTKGAAVLKALLEQRPSIRTVEMYGRERTHEFFEALTKDRFNCVFIDPFTFGVDSSIQLITRTRSDFPIVAFCLFSRAEQLSNLPGLDEPWRTRLEHYYRIPKDSSLDALDALLDHTIYLLSEYIQTAIATTKLSRLRTVLKSENAATLSNETKTKIEEATDAAEKALRHRILPADRAAIIPSFESSSFEKLLCGTIEQTSKSFRLSTTVNIAVLVFGAVMILGSAIVAAFSERWQLLLFGGFGMAGMVASLITNPLRTIGATARKLVQVQVAYFAFLKQLHMLSQESDGISTPEKSKQLGDEMARTLSALEEYLGDK